MKKKLIFIVLLAIVTIGAILYLKSGNKDNLDLIHNTEALANGENGGNQICIGLGNMDCAGEKVAYIIDL